MSTPTEEQDGNAPSHGFVKSHVDTEYCASQPAITLEEAEAEIESGNTYTYTNPWIGEDGQLIGE